MDDIRRLLRTYPRTRPPLPEAQRRIYEAEYRLNRTGARPVEGLAKRLERWMHRRVAEGAGEGPVLELGAGTLNHLSFEGEIGEYDIVEPFAALYSDRPERARIRDAFADIADVPGDRRYRRILSVAALEHVPDLPDVLARAGLLLAENGHFQAGIPSEGGLLWGLGWRLTTGVSYRLRTGQDYGRLMRHEHLSRAPEIIALVRHFFGEVSIRRFPLPAHHLSLYVYLSARRPALAACREQLAGRAA